MGDTLVLSTNKSIISKIIEAVALLEKYSDDVNWVIFVENNIKFIFINYSSKKTLIFHKAKIVCVHDMYINKSSALFCASMLVRWASILKDNLEYEDIKAKKKQINFLLQINSIESIHIAKYLKDFYFLKTEKIIDNL